MPSQQLHQARGNDGTVSPGAPAPSSKTVQAGNRQIPRLPRTFLDLVPTKIPNHNVKSLLLAKFTRSQSAARSTTDRKVTPNSSQKFMIPALVLDISPSLYCSIISIEKLTINNTLKRIQGETKSSGRMRPQSTTRKSRYPDPKVIIIPIQ